MNKKKFIGLLVFIVFSCSKTGDNSPPDNLISPNQMSMVMLDIILMKNIKRESYNVLEKKIFWWRNTFTKSMESIVHNSPPVNLIMPKIPKNTYLFLKKLKMKLNKLNDSIQQTMRIREE